MTAGHHLPDASGLAWKFAVWATSPLMRQTSPFSSTFVLDRHVNVLSVAIRAVVRSPTRTVANPVIADVIADARVVQHVV